MKYIIIVIAFLSAQMCIYDACAENDFEEQKLVSFVKSAVEFAKYLPQETVYLHLDNNSYYYGDDVWFAGYVVAGESLRKTDLSKTLYVELLNQGGEMIDKRILEIDSFGQCSGSFTLSRLPFYSGFCEVRAYTKYMLNFGDDIVFSRVFPVFEKPEKYGDFKDRKLQQYWYRKYPEIRKRTEKEKPVNVKFYPEGGRYVIGIESRVAFEATDEYGNPVHLTGKIINSRKEELLQFKTIHDGRGVFNIIPTKDKLFAVVNSDGREYRFELPKPESQGFVMTAYNLTNRNSIEIAIAKNAETPSQTLGVAVLTRGNIQNLNLIDFSNQSYARFKINKTSLPEGVSRIIMFNEAGNILSDRLVFAGKNKTEGIKIKTGKESYSPFEKVEMELMTGDRTPFSISVRDAADDDVEYGQNIMTYLLLTSEVKGFVRNPEYYFEQENHDRELDLLLMIQGWRRYSWEQMTGARRFELKYKPEKGIALSGKAVSMARSKPQPDTGILCVVSKLKDGKKRDTVFDGAVFTDSAGCFEFTTQIEGKWDLAMSTWKNGKAKDYRIILDRQFSPPPREYIIAEMQVNIAEDLQKTKKSGTEDSNSTAVATADSPSEAAMTEKVHQMEAVTVKGKKKTKQHDIYNARRNAIAYYDVQQQEDRIKDSRVFPTGDLRRLLPEINRDFRYLPQKDIVVYKDGSSRGKPRPLFIVDYRQDHFDSISWNQQNFHNIKGVKSVFVSEDHAAILKYCDGANKDVTPGMYNCVVFIETRPGGLYRKEEGRGVRMTQIEGYTPPAKEFYSPDYSLVEQQKDDRRRTLYWHPAVIPDSTGTAKIHFFNNSICRKFKISAESVTSDGTVCVIK
ncbi:MAG: hypothetical protein LBJ17_09465 [Dysgonamonadaceae bacterium]|jgi:hypothetical protein|nr:hypothetical protein [Dysgonamonadaceae bacterium]